MFLPPCKPLGGAAVNHIYVYIYIKKYIYIYIRRFQVAFKSLSPLNRKTAFGMPFRATFRINGFLLQRFRCSGFGFWDFRIFVFSFFLNFRIFGFSEIHMFWNFGFSDFREFRKPEKTKTRNPRNARETAVTPGIWL